VTYEYRLVPVAPDLPRDALRQMLAIHAEYGDWELSGHRIYPGGKRSVTVRRRVRSEAAPPLPS
jgi:GT2 family glycosyltransferase